MATSIRGRAGRRTAPHPSRQFIDRLEPRQMLAVTTLKDFGGLPRELTAVGPYVYFALDSGVDGHLSYVNLVEYNVKTGKQRSITKEGEEKFGQTQYYLSERDGALIVKEERSQDSFTYDYWRVPLGKTTATRIEAPSAED